MDDPTVNAAELPKLDAEFEEIIPQSRDESDMEFRQKMITKWPRWRRWWAIRSALRWWPGQMSNDEPSASETDD